MFTAAQDVRLEIKNMTFRIETFTSKLAAEFPVIRAIWLIGSRANRTANYASDRDNIVFADLATCSAISLDKRYHHNDVDLLVVTDCDNFQKPYGAEKRGSLTRWKWRELDGVCSTYTGSKFIPDSPGSQLGNNREKQYKAKLL